MSERNDRDERSNERRAAEGVRIIGPEEAQAALDAGAAAGRRADDELRFGDVPPAPPGPRPPHRFPLPDSVDPAAAVPRPPIAQVHPQAPTVVPDPPGASAGAVPEPAVTDETPPTNPAATAALASPPGLADPGPDPTHVTDAGPALRPGSAGLAEGGEPGAALGGRPVGPGPVAGADDRGARWTPEGYGREPGVSQPAQYHGPWSERPWSERPASFSAPAASERAWSATSSGWTPPPDVPASAAPREAAPDTPRSDPVPPEEGISVTGGFGTALPHWTDPPTGQVPRIRPEPAGGEGGDDLAAWEALGARGTRWRDDSTGWDHVDELENLVDEEAPVGALDQTRAEHSDLYSFDEDFERLEEERSGSHPVSDDDYEDFEDDEEGPVAVGAGPGVGARQVRSGAVRSRRAAPAGRPPGGPGSGADLGTRAAVGVGLIILLLVAYALGSLALLVLSTAVVLAAAVEVYGMLQRSGFRPATLLGLVATAGTMFAAYWRGVGAVGLLVVLVFVVTMLWYLLGIVEARPLANVAVTLVAFTWVGVLGSYAALLLRAHHGRGLFVGAILPAVAADIVAYFVGRRVGSRLLAPSVSPAKTLEGVLGGGAAAVVVGLIVGHWLNPWGGIKHGLLLGLTVAVLAPIGDLFESMIKRDLSVKDSGTALPGHGGVLDRFDSVLLVMPAAFYLASLFNVVR